MKRSQPKRPRKGSCRHRPVGPSHGLAIHCLSKATLHRMRCELSVTTGTSDNGHKACLMPVVTATGKDAHCVVK
jgi:hypothetical protein